jgi:hypothetical protein
MLHATTNGTATVRCRKVNIASLNPPGWRVECYFEKFGIGLKSELSKQVDAVGEAADKPDFVASSLWLKWIGAQRRRCNGSGPRGRSPHRSQL